MSRLTFGAIYQSVLYRPELDLHEDRRRELMRTFGSFALVVEPTERLAICPDPDDNRFLECAIAAEAAHLVTGNIRHFPRSHGSTMIVTPRQLLSRIVSTE